MFGSGWRRYSLASLASEAGRRTSCNSGVLHTSLRLRAFSIRSRMAKRCLERLGLAELVLEGGFAGDERPKCES